MTRMPCFSVNYLSKYFATFLAVSFCLFATNSEASRYYWRNGTGEGSGYYWRNGTGATEMFFVCLGLIDDNENELPEICEGYQ